MGNFKFVSYNLAQQAFNKRYSYLNKDYWLVVENVLDQLGIKKDDSNEETEEKQQKTNGGQG